MSELKQTDLSKRLRQLAGLRCIAEDHAKIMCSAADEIERYYTGMLNWKATAEAQSTQPEATKPAPWSQIAEGQTVTLNYSFASAVLGALFNGASNNPEAFEQIKQAFAAIMRGEKSPMPTCLSTKPAQDLSAATSKVREWIGRVCQQVRDDVAERKRTGEDEKFYTFTLNEMTHLLPILAQSIASPPNALSAGDRVDAERYKAALREAVLRDALLEARDAFHRVYNAARINYARDTARVALRKIGDELSKASAIQAQKDGHG